MRLIYNILFTICFVLSSPYYFMRMWRRGQWQSGFWQRFGVFDAKFKQSITNRHVLWMHAVSVGEVNICTQLIRALEPRMPNLKIVVSTTTSTGMSELQKKLPQHVGKFYYPIDLKNYVARALGTVRPEAVVLVEAEIWPNFIWRLRDKRIPLFLVNARLSAKSYRGYRRFGLLFRPLFEYFTGIGAQNEADAARLRELGCRSKAVQVTGNLKFDTATLHFGKPLDVPALLAQIGVAPDALLLVAGSTHEGEEEILARQFVRLRAKFPKLFLILAPRHFERAKSLAKQLEKSGLRLVCRTEITPATRRAPDSTECLLVNTTGELMGFYQVATVVFVGKSLSTKGGQNPIEPAALGKATVFGPHMQNFEDVARIFLAQRAAIQVSGEAELESTLAALLADEAMRRDLGQRAAQVVRENRGAIDRTVELIVAQLDTGDHYVKPVKQPDLAPR